MAPGRLPEMFAKMQDAFVRAGEEGSVTPIHMFYREWVVAKHSQALTTLGGTCAARRSRPAFGERPLLHDRGRGALPSPALPTTRKVRAGV